MSLQHDDVYSSESLVKNRIECNHPLNFYEFSCDGYFLLSQTLSLDFVLSYENLIAGCPSKKFKYQSA